MRRGNVKQQVNFIYRNAKLAKDAQIRTLKEVSSPSREQGLKQQAVKRSSPHAAIQVSNWQSTSQGPAFG